MADDQYALQCTYRGVILSATLSNITGRSCEGASSCGNLQVVKQFEFKFWVGISAISRSRSSPLAMPRTSSSTVYASLLGPSQSSGKSFCIFGAAQRVTTPHDVSGGAEPRSSVKSNFP